jgi:hypothetical protein
VSGVAQLEASAVATPTHSTHSPGLEGRAKALYREERKAARMTKEALYIRYRKDCLELAERSSTDSQRVMLLHIADTWQRLARSVAEEDDVHPSRVLH